MDRRKLLLALGGVGLIAFAAVAWYLGSPLFLDRTVEEEFPVELPSEAEMAEMSEEERQEVATEVMATSAAMPGKAMEEEMPAGEEPAALRSGAFSGADDFHLGSGRATIFQLSNGDRILRLEEFMVTNGPDLHVLLAESPQPTGQQELGNYLDLGSLKGNLGNQNYSIPTGTDLSRFQSVVIYCLPFHVVFATAPLGG